MSDPEEDDLILAQYRDDAAMHMRHFNDLTVFYGEEYAQQWAVSVTFPPPCPYCGDPMPYGYARIEWMTKHLVRRRHRVWWRLRGGARHT
jgi:hypothetical protein